jgi:hypothetical protein
MPAIDQAFVNDFFQDRPVANFYSVGNIRA